VPGRHDGAQRGHGQARADGAERHAARRTQVDLSGRREARGDHGLLAARRRPRHQLETCCPGRSG
jgi:hypothetical protein